MTKTMTTTGAPRAARPDITIAVDTVPDDAHARIAAACDLLDTAPWIVQDDVPLADVRGWIATIREHADALRRERDALRENLEAAKRVIDTEHAHVNALVAERDILRRAYLAAENWTYVDQVYSYGEAEAITMRDARRQWIGVTPELIGETT